MRFGFASHWLKNWRESFKPIIKRNIRNLIIIAFDSLLKTALLEHRMYVVNLSIFCLFILFYFFTTVDPQCQDNDPYKCPWLAAKFPAYCSLVLKCESEIQQLNKRFYKICKSTFGKKINNITALTLLYHNVSLFSCTVERCFGSLLIVLYQALILQTSDSPFASISIVGKN